MTRQDEAPNYTGFVNDQPIENPDELLDLEASDDADILEEAYTGTATDALTGAMNDSGMSEDLTQGYLGEGRHLGGATGGDVFGAGRGSEKHEEIEPSYEPGYHREDQ